MAKNYLNKRIVSVLWVLLIVVTSFVLYRDLFNTFFTQDEWWELGRAIDAQTQGIGYYFKPWGGHVVPLMLFFVNLQFKLFGTNIWPYAALAILGHSLIAVTLALLVSRVTQHSLVGWLSGLVFVVNTAPFHAVTYIAGGVTHIHGATFLFLVSLIFLAKYIQSNHKRSFFFLSLLSIVLAVFFMEYVAFYFFLAPFCCVLFSKQRSKKAFWIDQLVLAGTGLTFFVFRFLTQKIHIYGSQFIGARTIESSALRVESPLWDYFSLVVRNTQKLLPRALYQVWMNEDWINRSARFFKTLEDFLQIMPIVMVIFVVFTYFVLIKLRRFFWAKLSLAAAVVLVIGAFPAYIFPTFPNMIESRYLYAPALGLAVLVSLFLVSVTETIYSQFKFKQGKAIIFLIVAGVILLPLFRENYVHITGRLKNTVVISKMRQKILRQALEYYPKIKQKSIFYATTNLSTPGIPWPVSLGYTFLVMHTYQGDYQGGLEFFRSNKLWPVTEGYEEHGEYGFGLYFDFNNLMKIIRQYKLSEENVYAVRWEASQNSQRNLQVTHSQPPIYEGELVDTTNEIRPIIKRLLGSDEDIVQNQVAKYFNSEIDLSFDRQSKATFVDQVGQVQTVGPGVPRLTNGGRGKKIGILVEGYSINSLLFSEDMTQPVWEKTSGIEIVADVEIAPDGQETAEKLIVKNKNDQVKQKIFYSIRDVGKSPYTFSLYLKSSVPQTAMLKLISEGKDEVASQILIGSTWQRFQTTAPLVVGGPFEVALTGVVGDVLVWGGQVEESPYATSYIPTKDKVEFRAGDVFRAYSKKVLPMDRGAISLWFKPEWFRDDALNHILYYNGESTSLNSLKLEVDRGLLRFNIMDDAGGSKNIEQFLDSTNFKNNDWNHVVASWIDGRMALYLNAQTVGQVRGSGTGRPKRGLTFSDPFRVGVHHGWYSMYADAILSDLLHFPRVLSKEEIKDLYFSQK